MAVVPSFCKQELFRLLFSMCGKLGAVYRLLEHVESTLFLYRNNLSLTLFVYKSVVVVVVVVVMTGLL